MSDSHYEAVERFHRAHGFPVGHELQRMDPGGAALLGSYASDLAKVSRELLDAYTKRDGRPTHERDPFMRFHLIVEETAEAIEEAIKGDAVALLDALSDLDYVVNGTAVTWGLPLDDGFREVHLSNMTKERVPSDVHRDRLRKKGAHWIAPDLKTVLERQGAWERPTLLEVLAEIVAYGNVGAETLLDVLKSPPTSLESLRHAMQVVRVRQRHTDGWLQRACRLVEEKFFPGRTGELVSITAADVGTIRAEDLIKPNEFAEDADVANSFGLPPSVVRGDDAGPRGQHPEDLKS